MYVDVCYRVMCAEVHGCKEYSCRALGWMVSLVPLRGTTTPRPRVVCTALVDRGCAASDVGAAITARVKVSVMRE